MKSASSILVTLALNLTSAVWAQTADDYVAWGRADLSTAQMAAANANFANAVALDPNHPVANALYAATRLLSLPYQPGGSEFLTRLGVPAAGRDIYNWTAVIPEDRNGVPFVPDGLNGNEFSAFVRTNVLPQILGAEANLERITNRSFVLALSAGETRVADVTVDYGDIQMLRAMLYAAECSAYSAGSWNVDSRLDVLRSLYTSDKLSLQRLLMDYPDLMTFATTNDLNAARQAFLNAVNCYLAASDWIRDRSPTDIRLFNYDPDRAADEQNFRQTLIDLTNSLAGAVPLSVATNYTVFLGAQFNGIHPPRSFLPEIIGNSFVLGTLPDPAFGGLIEGLPVAGIESFLGRQHLSTIPKLWPLCDRTGGQFGFPVATLTGRGYVVQASTNLTSWSDVAAFVGTTDHEEFIDPDAADFSRRFYRVVDRTADMPPPPNDHFADRIVLSGLGITAYGYTANATSEPGEPGYAYQPTAWWSWTAPISGTVAFSLAGSQSYPYALIYTGDSFGNLVQVGDSDWPIQVTAGTTYQIQVFGNWIPPGAIKLTITAPPVVTVFNPADHAVLSGPTNVVIDASATDPDGSIVGMSVFADYQLLGSAEGGVIHLTWTNVTAGLHELDVVAKDNLGVKSDSYISFSVAPPNDNFADRIPLAGGSVVAEGSNRGATKEPGEPQHAGYSGGQSVWWSWTAPSNGTATVSATFFYEYWDDWEQQWYWYNYGYPIVAVYTWSSMSGLTAVASNSATYYGALAQAGFSATAGTTYQIAVDDRYGYQGRISLQLVAFAPPNDNFANRIPLPGPAPVTNGCNFFATREPGEPLHAGVEGSGSVWWSWTATSNGPAVITAGLSDRYEAVGGALLGVYTGNTLSGLTPVASDAAPSYGEPAQAEFLATAGTTYQIAVDSQDTGEHNVGLRLGPEPETPIALNTPIKDLSGQMGGRSYFNLNVPPGLSTLRIRTFDGSGDCDLYVRHGSQPTLSSWDYRPYMDGNDEIVTIPNPAAGEWHIMLDGYKGYIGATLEAW